MVRAHHSHSFPQNILRHHWARVHSKKFQQKSGAHPRAGIHSDFPTVHPSISPSSGPTENFWGNPHIMPWVPFHSKLRALDRLDYRFGVHFRISNNNPEHIAELGPIQVSNHISSHFAELGSDWKFPRKPPSQALSSFPFRFPTTGLSRSLSWGPSRNFQPGTPPHLPAWIQLKKIPGNLHGLSWAHTKLRPKQISIICTQPHFCFKLVNVKKMRGNRSMYVQYFQY